MTEGRPGAGSRARRKGKETASVEPSICRVICKTTAWNKRRKSESLKGCGTSGRERRP